MWMMLRRRAVGGGEGGSAEPKTRTPHKDVGKKQAPARDFATKKQKGVEDKPTHVHTFCGMTAQILN
jgi:hypothetical protein